MKKFIGRQRNCFYTLIGLIAVSETLLRINNKIIQSFGIILLPFIIYFGLLLFKNDQKKDYE